MSGDYYKETLLKIQDGGSDRTFGQVKQGRDKWHFVG
jgi:hypothetical protein